MAANKPPPKKSSGGATAVPGTSASNPLKKPAGTPAANPLQKPSPVSRPASAQPAQPAGPAKPAIFGSTGSARKAPSNVPSAAAQTRAPAPAGAGVPAQQRPGSDEPRIEERAFAIRSVREAQEPPIFARFIEKIVPKIQLRDTTRAILDAFSNIDVKAERVAQIIQANPYYEYLFFRVIQSLSKRENVDRLESAIVLLGMQNSRNLLVALQALRMVRGGHPEWTKEGKLKVQPNDVLRYALRTEEALAGNKDSYADTAYAAGLIFDILTLVADQVSTLPPPEKKKLFAYIDGVYLHGLRSAQLAAEIAKNMPELGFRKYVFSACLIHDIGKIVLAILEPSYLAFLEECGKKGLARNVRLFAETRRFGVNHALIGALCCEYFRTFHSIGKVIQYHHEPFLLRGGKSGLGQLASVVSLATNMASNFKKVDKADDPVLALWKGPELQTFPIDARSMIQIASRVV